MSHQPRMLTLTLLLLNARPPMETPRSGTFLSLREKAERLFNDLLRRHGDSDTLDATAPGRTTVSLP